MEDIKVQRRIMDSPRVIFCLSISHISTILAGRCKVANHVLSFTGAVSDISCYYVSWSFFFLIYLVVGALFYF